MTDLTSIGARKTAIDSCQATFGSRVGTIDSRAASTEWGGKANGSESASSESQAAANGSRAASSESRIAANGSRASSELRAKANGSRAASSESRAKTIESSTRPHGAGLVAVAARSGAIVAALAAAGCSVDEPDPNVLLPGAPVVTAVNIPVDPDAALSQIANQGYLQSPAFTQASTLYPSTKDPVDIIEWVSTAGDAAAAYAQISPEADAGPANVTLPTGSIIVRAVYALPDAGSDGAVQALTVLVKGPPGTNQSVGDWWFGITDPNGTPQALADGGPAVGLVMTGQCESCHTGRGGANDYLFGVPPTARTPSFSSL